MRLAMGRLILNPLVVRLRRWRQSAMRFRDGDDGGVFVRLDPDRLFVVDGDLRVWLCEVNASPAVANALLPGLVLALIRRAIDPICVPDASRVDVPVRSLEGETEAWARTRGEDFECIMAGPR